MTLDELPEGDSVVLQRQYGVMMNDSLPPAVASRLRIKNIATADRHQTTIEVLQSIGLLI